MGQRRRAREVARRITFVKEAPFPMDSQHLVQPKRGKPRYADRLYFGSSFLDRERDRSPAYYRAKAEIMRRQAERALSEHMQVLYRTIAENWDAVAEGKTAPEQND